MTSDEHTARTTHDESGVDRSMRGFSGAFGENEFERMKESQHITIHDYYGMGSMSEFAYYVSFSVPTTAISDTEEP